MSAPRGIPAEATGVGGVGIAGVLALAGAPAEAVAIVAAAAGLAPVVVTGWIRAGGLVGVRELFLRGRRPT